MSGNVHEAEVSSIRTVARDSIEYVLATDAALSFRPGQFISLRVGKDRDDNPILRSYSIASSPGAAELSLIVKRIDGGAASEWFSQLKVGQRLEFTGPMGFFVLDLAHSGDLLFGATGVGIAPVLPMVKEALARKEAGRVMIFWGNRDREDLFWQGEFDDLTRRHPRLSVRYFLSSETSGWSGERGRITPAVIEALPRLERPTFYLVGNGAMIRELKAELVARGIDRKRQIRNEAFFD